MSNEAMLRMCVHGTVVLLRCGVPSLRPAIARLLGSLAVNAVPDGFSTIEGDVLAYDADAVSRHLSPTATRIAELSPLAELYRENERLWLVDDTWGLCEINLLRRQWRSWVLPGSSLDPVERVEAAVHLPLAYLLRTHGTHLVPAAAVADADAGALLIGSLSLEPELRALRRLGMALVAQRWLTIRDEPEGVALWSMPSLCSVVPPPKRAATASVPVVRWLDLFDEPLPARNHAFCRSVLLIESVRQSRANATPLGKASLQQQLRERWPVFEPTPARATAGLLAALTRASVGWRLQLSRNADESARLIASLLRPVTQLRASVRVPRPTRLAAAG